MSELIEVLGQFDVRRDVVPSDPETSAPGIMERDKTLIKNTFYRSFDGFLTESLSVIIIQ